MDVSAIPPTTGTIAVPPSIAQHGHSPPLAKTAAGPIDLVGESPYAAASIADAPSPAPANVSADLLSLPLSVRDAPSPVPRAHFEGSA